MSNELVTLFTPEGEVLQQGGPLAWDSVYPRPALVRDSFYSLNGFWQFGVYPPSQVPDPTLSADEVIRVPFAPESPLSGIYRTIPTSSLLVYRRSFSLPDGFVSERVLLHIGACDAVCEVYLNEKKLGGHQGGYLPFSFDITPYLEKTNRLTILVRDPLDDVLPYGKQRVKRGGMWYTPVSGIWQSVWLESVPADYVRALSIQADTRGMTLTAVGVSEGLLTIETPSGEVCLPLKDGKAVFSPENPRLWSPEDPYLYRFTLTSEKDTVRSYFALREMTVGTLDGIPRLFLNGKPYFFHGLLDQGYYSDGLFTPADPVLYEKDILSAKAMGFNTLRKHIKIEPQLFYYQCDRLGMVIFQDMVNNGRYSFFRDTILPTLGIKRLCDDRLHRKEASRRAFLSHMEETALWLKNHPSILLYTIFNEGWGQFEADAAYKRLKTLDPTRLIDSASGWFEAQNSDVVSPHIYVRRIRLLPKDKPILLSEFGGYSLKVQGHVFNKKKTFGYRAFFDSPSLEQALEALYQNEVVPAIANGLCGAIYTQLSDVEDETNGLLTYDRRVQKVSFDKMSRLAALLRVEDDG